jgi:SAM-dependent methyltransferase
MLKSLLVSLFSRRRIVPHYYESIQGWCCYTPLYSRMVRVAPVDTRLVFVELGCWKGRSTAFLGVEIANSGKPITLYAIDWFSGSDEIEHRNDPEIAILYEAFLRNTQRVSAALGERFIVLKESTAAAARRFADASVDFVMVDAGHTAEDVNADIRAWWPKLRPGGMMAGDDWRWPGVQAGVDIAFGAIADRKAFQIENTEDYPWWIAQKAYDSG